MVVKDIFLNCVLMIVFFVGSRMLVAVPADCIIFSYDRPMQLYALLETMEHYLTGVGEITVLCRADERFMPAYAIVQERFSAVHFSIQTNAPYDFKPLLLQAFEQGNSPYLFFAVDDIIVKNYADLNHCSELMERYDSYAFYLRLGRSITTIFPTGQPFSLPALQEVVHGVYTWDIMENQSIPYWGYPHTVDMTIYRKDDIKSDLQVMDYKNPNLLEGIWCGKTAQVRGKKGLCFARTVMVNVVVNQVQKEWQNPHQERWSTEQLLDLFLQGFCIDTTQFCTLENHSCHHDCSLQFVTR